MRHLELSGRVLARNTLFNFVGQAIPLLIGIVTIPFVVDGLGTERFGILSLAWVVMGSFGTVDLGLGWAVTKFVASALGEDETEKIPPLVWTAVATQALFGVLGATVLLAITPFLVQRVFSIPAELVGEAEAAFRLLALSLPPTLISISFRGTLEAAQRFDLVNAVRVCASSATFLMPLAGIILGWGLPGILMLLFLTRVLVSGGYFVLCLRVFPRLKRVRFPRWAMLSRLLSFGGWVTVSGLAGPILVYLDRFAIATIRSMTALAYYTVPHEMVMRLGIISASLVMVLFPAFSTLGGTDDLPRLRDLFARAVKYILVIVGPIVGILFVLAPDILRLWLGAEFAAQSTWVLRFLAVAILTNAVAGVPYALIQGLGRADITAKFHLVELPVHVIFVWLFVSLWGTNGAALAWTLRVALDAVLLFGAADRRHVFSPRAFMGNDGLRPIAMLAVFTVAAYGLYALPVAIPVRLVLLLALGVALAWWAWWHLFEAGERTWLTTLIGRRIG